MGKLWIVVAVLALVCALPARALASDTQESIMMDDDQLIYAPASHVKQALHEMAALGVDRVKVSVVWTLIAPDPKSRTRPNFDATNPGAYPDGAWDRYDLIVHEAKKLGLGVYFQITPPAPAWAVARGRPTQGYTWSQRPNPTEFEQFVQAVGHRYSGSFAISHTTTTTVPRTLLGIPLGSQTTTTTSSDPIPRVSYFGIWNEPNEGAWLNPYYRRGPHGFVIDLAAVQYRSLVDAGYAGLAASGHAGDTILIGETASGGTTFPKPLVRDLYCVNRRLRPLRGRVAKWLSCPASGNRAAFVAAHPGLFRSTGFAHHPYSFDQAPDKPMPNPGIITLANLRGFERVLDGIFRAYGQPTGFPLYLTEWGYKTDPPNPFVRTSLGDQETFINQGEYLAWKDPRVRGLAQFLLVDDKPRSGAKPGTLRYWSTFQTGLEYASGERKPSYAAYRIPIWLPRAQHGPSVAVWGQLRPANHDTIQYAVLQYQSSPAADWLNLRELQTSSSQGFLYAHLAIPAAGLVRLAWLNPSTGAPAYSRIVAVS
jgi:hypothetical protein